MMTTRRDPAARLDEALDLLPRDVPPGRDLWPGIEARLEPRPTPAHRRWLPMAAAAVALVAVTALVTAALVRREAPEVAQAPAVTDRVAPAAFGPGRALDPAFDAARVKLSKELSARLDRLPPDAREKVQSSLAELRRAGAEINAALELQPGDPLLEELLLNTYQDELAMLASVTQLTAAGGPGAPFDDTRIQL